MLAFFLLSFGLPPASACSFRTCLLSQGTAVPAPPGAAAPWVRPGPPAPQSTPVRNYCVWAGIAYTLLLGLGLSQATPSIQVALLEGLLQGFSSSPSRRATQSIQVALLEGLLQGFSSSPSRRATPSIQGSHTQDHHPESPLRFTPQANTTVSPPRSPPSRGVGFRPRNKYILYIQLFLGKVSYSAESGLPLLQPSVRNLEGRRNLAETGRNATHQKLITQGTPPFFLL